MSAPPQPLGFLAPLERGRGGREAVGEGASEGECVVENLVTVTAIPLSVSAAPSHLSPHSWGEEPKFCSRGSMGSANLKRLPSE